MSRPCLACDGLGKVMDLEHSEACYRFGECVGGDCPKEVEVDCPVCGGDGDE